MGPDAVAAAHTCVPDALTKLPNTVTADRHRQRRSPRFFGESICVHATLLCSSGSGVFRFVKACVPCCACGDSALDVGRCFHRITYHRAHSISIYTSIAYVARPDRRAIALEKPSETSAWQHCLSRRAKRTCTARRPQNQSSLGSPVAGSRAAQPLFQQNSRAAAAPPNARADSPK